MATKPTKIATHTGYVEKPISPVTQNFIAWLQKETGYPVDARTVSLALDLHGRFQKSPGNQKRIAEAKQRNAAVAAARAERKAARSTAATAPEPEQPKDGTPAAKKPVARRRTTTKASE